MNWAIVPKEVSMLRYVINVLLCCVLLSACEKTHSTEDATYNPITNEDIPASWEDDWSWDMPDSGALASFDAGISTLPDVVHVCPTDASLTSCAPGEPHGSRLVISVSSRLLPDCAQGHVIHAWGAGGQEFISAPDQSLEVTLPPTWRGAMGFNVTCGSSWSTLYSWSTASPQSLENTGLVSVSIDGHSMMPNLRICPMASDGSPIPVIPLICGESPC